jgi:hypothetical protein
LSVTIPRKEQLQPVIIDINWDQLLRTAKKGGV